MSHIKQITFEGQSEQSNRAPLIPGKLRKKNLFLLLNSGLVLFKGDV